MSFSAEDELLRQAKREEPGAMMVQLSNGYEVFTQKFGESDDVKKKWLQYAIDNKLIDTKQIPKVVVAHYRNLGVIFPPGL